MLFWCGKKTGESGKGSLCVGEEKDNLGIAD